MAYVCNLSPSHRPPQPSLKNGPVQRRVRRAFVATGQSVLSTTQIMDWSHPRPGTNRHHARRSVRRVCTRDQDLIAQDAELMAAGCAKVFKEKISGAKTDRPELAKVIRRLEPGDVLLVTRLDRLARSTRDLLNILATIAERQAGFRSLKDTWADTTTPHGRLMLTVLGGLAEFERELIRSRTGEGRKRAQARGVKFGRPPKLTAHQRQEALQRLAAGETQADIARTYNVDASIIGRLEPRPFE